MLLFVESRHVCSVYFSGSAILLQYEDDGGGGGGCVVAVWDSSKEV